MYKTMSSNPHLDKVIKSYIAANKELNELLNSSSPSLDKLNRMQELHKVIANYMADTEKAIQQNKEDMKKGKKGFWPFSRKGGSRKTSKTKRNRKY
jgi:hypothetical protein